MPNGHDDEFPWPGAYNRESLERALEEAEVLVPLAKGWKSLMSHDDLCDLIKKENLLKAGTYWTVISVLNRVNHIDYVKAPRADIAAKKVMYPGREHECLILAIYRGKLKSEYSNSSSAAVR